MPTTTQHIPEELIKKALALCGKKITDMYEEISHEDMNEEEGGYDILIEHEFSIEKLAYFLLSPEFIEKYPTYSTVQTIAHDFGEAIWHYQFGNSKLLISLLEKI